MEGQLNGELVAPLRGADDVAVAEVKNDLERLFDSQITILEGRGVPKQIVGILQSLKSAVVQRASRGMTIGEGKISFLPVIKPAYLSYYGLMAMVRNGSKEGYAYLNPATVTDQFETPDDLYYIYDVEDGNVTRGKRPWDAEKIFKEQSRLPLTAVEDISLCILTDVLSRHHVWALGSRYKSADRVPLVDLGHDARPGLVWNYGGNSDGHWGSPSCGSR